MHTADTQEAESPTFFCLEHARTLAWCEGDFARRHGLLPTCPHALAFGSCAHSCPLVWVVPADTATVDL